MTTDERAEPLNLQLAWRDPGAVFATPEQVRDHAELTTEQKIEVLKRWAYDVSEASVAAEEGMPENGWDDLEQRILLALDALGDDPSRPRADPSKQHGL